MSSRYDDEITPEQVPLPIASAEHDFHKLRITLQDFRPVPLHSGFGFGAKLLENLSKGQSPQRKSKVFALLDPTLSKPPALASVAIPDTPLWPERNLNTVAEKAKPEQESIFQFESQAHQVQKVGYSRCIFAWSLDLFVTSCIVALTFAAASLFSPSQVIARLVLFLETRGSPGVAFHAHDLSLGLFVWAATIFTVFFVQSMVALSVGASAGRYSVGMRLRQKENGQNNGWIRGLLIGISEALTLGGLLLFPLVLVLPRRVPLFPWLRYEQNFNDGI